MEYNNYFDSILKNIANITKMYNSDLITNFIKNTEETNRKLSSILTQITNNVDYNLIIKNSIITSEKLSSTIAKIYNNSDYFKMIPNITINHNVLENFHRCINNLNYSEKIIDFCNKITNEMNLDFSREEIKDAICEINDLDEKKPLIKSEKELLYVLKKIIIWLLITFAMQPLLTIPQEKITEWYKEQFKILIELLSECFQKLGNICYFSNQKINSNDLSDENYISTENMISNFGGVVKAKSVSKNVKFNKFNKNDILISNIRPYFKKMWYATFDGGCSNDIIVIKTNNDINSKFLFYSLMEPNFFEYVTLTSKGTKMPRGDKEAILSYELYVPSLENQNKIVKIISAFDNKIELNNKINDNLEEICDTLYKSYFDNNDDEYLEIKLSDVAKNIITGKTPSTSKKEYWGDEIPFVTIPDIHNDVFTIYTERSLSNEGNYSQQKKLLPKDSIMVSCIATVGLISINSKPSHTNQQINAIIIDNDYDLYFLYENMKTRVDELKAIGSTGSATLNVNLNEFKKLLIKYPQKEKLIDFDCKVKPLFKKMLILQEENITLSNLRGILLPNLLSGDVDLDNIV